MKTNVRTTSIETFFGIQSTLNKREKELLVVMGMFDEPVSDRQLANALHWEIGSVNGRRNSLVEKGVICESHRDKSPITGRRVIYWKLNNPSVQQPLF